MAVPAEEFAAALSRLHGADDGGRRRIRVWRQARRYRESLPTGIVDRHAGELAAVRKTVDQGLQFRHGAVHQPLLDRDLLAPPIPWPATRHPPSSHAFPSWPGTPRTPGKPRRHRRARKPSNGDSAACTPRSFTRWRRRSFFVVCVCWRLAPRFRGAGCHPNAI